MVAVSGETTAWNALKHIEKKMLSDATGSRILKEQPRITSEIINFDKLGELPENTFGRKYADMMNRLVSILFLHYCMLETNALVL